MAQESRKPPPPPLQDIIQCLRAELWAKAMGSDDFSGFVTRHNKGTNPEKCGPNPEDTVLYVRE
jgi:hypothetical protein